MTNYKTYIFIDFNNDIYAFVNNASEIVAFYEDELIPINTLPVDVDGYLDGAILVNLKTKEETKVKLIVNGSDLCI
jgi:hypothetical protein